MNPAEQPQVPERWIPMNVRKPSEKDANADGDVWFWIPKHASHGAQRDCWDLGEDATHWMPDDGLGEAPSMPTVRPDDSITAKQKAALAIAERPNRQPPAPVSAERGTEVLKLCDRLAHHINVRIKLGSTFHNEGELSAFIYERIAPDLLRSHAPHPRETEGKGADFVEWVEPFHGSEPVYMRVSLATAIAHQKRATEQSRPGFKYATDQQAFDDFVAVHWALPIPTLPSSASLPESAVEKCAEELIGVHRRVRGKEIYVVILRRHLVRPATTEGMYDVSDTAREPFKKYFVLVKGRGWTDGQYRTDEPIGWCHKWALDSSLSSKENRGVTHYMEMPSPKPATEKQEGAL